ncbi:5-dehydro-2-deoxygluconokinase [Nitrobacteraceae bacterium AZCC 1564]
MTARTLDLITMGRAIVDIYGDQVGCGLEEVSSFSRYVGGCPTNIAIGARRLGLRTGLIARVGDEQNGRFIVSTLQREGVDTSCVVFDPTRLTGVAFLGIRDDETFPLLHYRRDCADMAVCPDDYTAEYITSARSLLVSGSHLVTQTGRDNIAHAVQLAKNAGTKVVFDIDYRPLFWGLVAQAAGESRYVTSETATIASQEVLPHCDLIIGTEEEFHIAGGSPDTSQALSAVRALSSAALVLKRGANGCSVFPGALDQEIRGPGFPVDVFNVVGAGDGFASGFLYGWLREMNWSDCCRAGNACGALVVSRHGCSPASPTRAELDWFLAQSAVRKDLHRSRELAHIHRATTRLRRPDRLFIVAADHSLPFENLPAVPGRTVQGLKRAVARSVLKLSHSNPGIGLLMDDVSGRTSLVDVGTSLPWIGRKIEQTGHSPIAFTDDLPAALLLQSWPRSHIVKCLVPRCKSEDWSIQAERLRELDHACNLYGIELLLELVEDDNESGTQ